MHDVQIQPFADRMMDLTTANNHQNFSEYRDNTWAAMVMYSVS
jgi:hypothetical protein